MYKIFTDGSTKGNGRAINTGGWAFIVVEDGIAKHWLNGSTGNTTNQKMELTACIEALKFISKSGHSPEPKIHIYSDSAYLINCYEKKWYKNWEKNGWVNSKKEPVANKELWEQLLPYFKDKKYAFHKVEGHADNHFNNMADYLAQIAAEGKYPNKDFMITRGWI